jgi:CDP-diacylglycerol--glycerol-3-phosphate 3-phosphatidyltransferase
MPPTTTSGPITITDRARRFFAGFLDPVTGVLARLGVTPNALTIFGALMNLAAGLIAASGHLTLAGIVWLAAGLFDSLDGALARRVGATGKFGAFLDSTLDRYSDAFILGGILIYAGDRSLLLETRLVFVTLVGALLISYTRARAQSLGIDCKVGLLSRLERFLIVAVMLIVQQVTVGLLALAILTHVTVIQRIIYVGSALRRAEHTRND